MPHALRRTLVVVALVGATLGVTAASSLAASTHRLNIQKQDTFFTVPAGSTADKYVACPAGTAVLSGSIRVDSVPGGKLSDVRAVTSAPDSDPAAADQTVPTEWFYTLVNNAPSGSQPAQVKLFTVCLKTQTESGSGSQHSLVFAPRQDAGATFTNASAERTTGLTCDKRTDQAGTSSYLPTDAGFTFDGPTRSRDLSLSGTSMDSMSMPSDHWDFGLANTTGTTPLDFYPTLWCLQLQTGQAKGAGGHRHALGTSLQEASGVPLVTTSGNDTMKVEVSCPSDSFGVEGGYYISDRAIRGGAAMVGVEPQDGKTIFSFVNPKGVSGELVDAQLICLAKTTGTDNGPAPVSNGTCFVAQTRMADSGHMGHAQCAQKLSFSTRTKPVKVAAGATATASLGCTSAQIVVGGAVNGAGARSVSVGASGYDATTGKWAVSVRNRTGKQVRVTLAVKCLTGSAGMHTLITTSSSDATCPSSAFPIRMSTVGLSTRPTVSCVQRNTTSMDGYHHTLMTKKVTGTVRVTGSAKTKALACPLNYEAVTPAVALGGKARLAASTMAAARWTFRVTGKGTAKLGLTCVRRGTTKAEMDSGKDMDMGMGMAMR